MKHTTIVDELPDCDFCSELGLSKPAAYDGRVKGVTSWASMCPAHFEIHGVGLGLGVGQEYILRTSVAGEASAR